VLGVLQQWLGGEEAGVLVVVTRGAVAVAEGESADPAVAAVWGLVRSAQAEEPGRVVLADVDSEVAADALAVVVEAGEPQVAVRGGEVLVPRVIRSAEPAVVLPESAVLDPAGAVLITGGTGGLGGVLARHLVSRHGVRQLVLASRRGPAAEGADELVTEIERLGAAVQVVACDVADRDAVHALVASIPQLCGVVHAAGVLDDAMIGSLDRSRIETVLAPKADAAWWLHEATQDRDLAWFVLFSSLAGVIGSPGQGNYAAANAFLDALARTRHAHGLSATSIAWGLWARESALTAGVDTARMRRSGVLALTEEHGLALFDAAVEHSGAATMAARLDLSALTELARLEALPPMLSDLVTSTRRTVTGAGPVASELVQRLRGVDTDRQHSILLDLVRNHVAVVLGHDGPDHVDSDRNFGDLGVESLSAVEARNRLQAATGLTLPVTLVFDYPTPTAVANYLHDQLVGRVAAPPTTAVLSELERIDALLSATADAQERIDVISRLERMLSKCRDSWAPADEGDIRDTLQTASADELSDFIRTQLGKSTNDAATLVGEV
jgi:NADP-dependent 3-hydroxy acid dehydrogenase YdfG/acyl carrier protein